MITAESSRLIPITKFKKHALYRVVQKRTVFEMK